MAETLPLVFPLAGKRVWVAGHRGMVGAAIVRRMERDGIQVLRATRNELELRDQAATRAWLERTRPDAIFVAAAKVGGILANMNAPADFLYDNLILEANIIEGAWRAGVSKLLFLGSSCIYPKLASQPMREDELLTGPLEPTNEWYAIAKIAGIKLCQAFRQQHGADFISAMPTNLYGPGDNFDLNSSHVLPALMRKAHEAARSGAVDLPVWGSGRPLREFLHVDDLAEACLFLMERYSGDGHVNVGSGEEVSIAALAAIVSHAVAFEGRLVFDASKPDGTPRKLMDSGLIRAMGWAPRIGLHEGVERTYRWYLENAADRMPA